MNVIEINQLSKSFGERKILDANNNDEADFRLAKVR